MTTAQYELVHFRLIAMPCCKHHLCWVNPRLPNYCPECGSKVDLQHTSQESILMSHKDASLSYIVE